MTDRGAVEVAATASTTAREARRTSNMSVSQSSEDLVPGMRDRWRTVLTRANQELLRELAKHAATQGADGAGGMPIETIMDVAVEKVLADVPFLQHMATPVADGPEVDEGAVGVKEITEPQLDDIKAVPWNVWSRSDVVNAPPTDSPLGFEGCEQFFPRLGSFNRTASQDATTMTAGLRLLPTTRQHTMMRWSERPKTVMIVAKQGDLQVTRTLREMAVWLDSQKVTVVLEPELMAEIHRVTAASSSDAETGIERSGSASSLLPYDRPASTNNAENHKWEWGNTESLPSGFVSRLRTWTPNVDRLERRIDLLICVGGDGTLCWSAGLFPEAMPPVIAFAGGSLGFLTPFPMQDWMAALVPMIYVAPPAELRQHRLTCRMRFQLRVLRANKKRDIEGVPLAEAGRDHEISHWVPLQALNEVLLHRGSNASLVKLDVTVGKTPITLVQGDGLILATPTGSTAYSLAAGGSIVHPSVPGIILTPVCPHSLSFRPVVLPDSAVVKIKVPKGARTYQVMVAVDGKEVIELNWGDSLEVSVSPYPMPTICKDSETDDWFRAVNGGLRWNLRSEQKGVNP